jgi:hypothetical protein
LLRDEDPSSPSFFLRWEDKEKKRKEKKEKKELWIVAG